MLLFFRLALGFRLSLLALLFLSLAPDLRFDLATLLQRRDHWGRTENSSNVAEKLLDRRIVLVPSPSGKISSVNATKSQRRLDPLDKCRDQDASPKAVVRFLQDPGSGYGMLRP